MRWLETPQLRSLQAARERGGGQCGRQSSGLVSFGPFCPCDAAEPQRCGPGPRQSGGGGWELIILLLAVQGGRVGFSPGQGKPTQEASWASVPARQTDSRRGHSSSRCSWRGAPPSLH